MPEEMGDPGEALRLFLRSRTAVTALTGDRISLTLGGSLVSIRYSLAGGRAAYSEHDPLYLVECWGTANAPDDGKAMRTALRVAEAVEEFRGEWGGCWVAGAAVEGGPYSNPDPQTQRPRCSLTIRLQSYPSQQAAG